MLRLPIALSLAVSLLVACAAPTPTTDFGDYDKALVQELQEEGLSEPEALFLALTKIEGERTRDNVVRIVELFPTGNRAEITVTVNPDQRGDPDILKVSHSESADEFKFKLEYFVPNDAIPEEVRNTIGRGEPAAIGPPLAMGSLAAAGGALSAESDGVMVVVEAVVDELREAKIDFLHGGR